MIMKLILWKRSGKPLRAIPAGIALYLLNLLLALDFAIAAIIGVDPRLTISALFGIRLKKNPDHKILSKLPGAVQDHFLNSASWWNYGYPPVNRSIWM